MAAKSQKLAVGIERLKNVQIRDLSGGMVSNVADVLIPQNVCKQSINFHYDNLGNATQRYGTTLLGSTVASGTCTGLFQFINEANTLNRLVAGFGAHAYSYDGTNWSSVASGLDGTPIRMVSFLDNVIMTGGGSAPMAWNGGGNFSTSSPLLTNAPSGKYVETFLNRIYIAGSASNPHRLWYTTVASLDGTVAWDQSLQYLDVNPEDTNIITGLIKIANLLLIFKKFTMYRWDGSSTDAEIVNDIGSPSQESIKKAKGMVFFFSQDPLGIYVTSGGYPQEISRAVADWLKGMDASFYSSVSAASDDDHYYCSIGNVTKDGRTYSNVWLVYTISSQNWSVYTLGSSFRAMNRYINTSGNVTMVGGDTSGNVQTLLSGTTDNGTPIEYEYQSRQWEFDSRATTKTINKMAAFVQNGAGSTVSLSVDSGPFKPVGEITGPVTIFKSTQTTGHYISVKISGQNRQTPVVLSGFEFIEMNTQGYIS
ncbi:MAG: hypothetical protein KGL39_47200 [Patescibacteria group bacterium]|nr:hypothetical protein [Patescibacteria group bacterium]